MQHLCLKERRVDRLTVPGTLGSLPAISEYAVRAATAADLDQKATYKLRLAIDEIATNIIVHGYDEAGIQGPIDIWFEIDDTDLRIVLEDMAMPFDPWTLAPPMGMDLPLEERQIGGLGVFLALQSVDELVYERIGDHNRNIFVMHRPAVR
jgi:anti-sigma regulatory factor (Ser/Thr protein kinase)